MTTSSTAFGTSKHSPTPKVYLQPLSSGTSLFFMGNNCQVTLHPDDVLVAQEIVRRVNGWEKVTELLKRCSGFFNTLKDPPIIALTGVQLWKEIEQALTEAGEA